MRSLVHLTDAAELPRGGADENLLRIERALAAEAAADVGRDHAQPVARQVERLGQRVAHDAGDLRRGVEGQRVAAGSYSARHARGSIATGVLRRMRKRPLTRTGAASIAASTSPRLNSRATSTLVPASSCRSGAPAARPRPDR